MSLIQPALFQFLSSITELTDVIETKIYPAGAVPTGTQLPYLTWNKTDNVHTHHQGGSSGLAEPRLQLDIWATTEYAAALTFDILRRNLDGFVGTWGVGADEVTIRVSILETDREDYSPPDDGTQRGAHRASGDFLVWFVEGG